MRLRFVILTVVILSCWVNPSPAQEAADPLSLEVLQSKADYKEYLAFFMEVYKKMEQEYYYPVTRESFNKFLYVFNNKIYSQLIGAGKSSNYVKWRSAAFLVDALKSSEDVFSKFYPPTVAKEFEATVLGKKIDLGIEGKLTNKGYEVTQIQIRADAYEKGLRTKDVILKIDKVSVLTLTEDEIEKRLVPDEGETVALHYLDHADNMKKTIDVVSKEYFKQFVFLVPVDVPNIYCIQIQKFNRTTGEDLEMYMKLILEQEEETALIIDLRGNPGGPPLAAREISGFFLPPEEEFAYFQRRNRPKAPLFIPSFPQEFHYKGDIVVLVDEKSGSASELFSGILQHRGRAVVMGKNTAGQVLLKSMFYFDDDSMVALVTARGFHPDGTVFSYDGVTPDETIEDKDIDLIDYAAEYLLAKRKKNLKK